MGSPLGAKDVMRAHRDIVSLIERRIRSREEEGCG